MNHRMIINFVLYGTLYVLCMITWYEHPGIKLEIISIESHLNHTNHI